MENISNQNTGYLILIFFISPFLSLILALKHLKVKLIENIIWANYTFLGFILVKTNSTTDVYRYSYWFESFARMEYIEKLKFFENESKIDIFRTFSFHFISLFSTSSSVYFAFIGCVYGFFYSRIIGIILQNIHNKMLWFDKLFIFTFIAILPFTSVQFVRFSTATVVFIYFTLKYFLDGNSIKYLVLACIGSMIIHFSFALPAVALILFVFLPKKLDIYFYAFAISSFFIIVEFSALKVLIENYIPSDLESKKSYLNEDYAEAIVESVTIKNWYIQYGGEIIKYITLILLFYIRNLIRKGLLSLGKYKHLLLFGLFLATISNIVSVVPSGFRFLGVSYPIIWTVLTIIYVNNNKCKENYYIKLILFLFFIFQILVELRIATDIISIDFFASNPIFMFFGLTDIPIIDFIK